MESLKIRTVSLLRWSEQYTKTDMVYLAGGSFWLMLEQAVGILTSFALAVAFGHFASQDLYGNYKYILSLAGLLTAVSLSGLGDALSQAVAKGYEGSLSQSLRLQLRWSMPFVVVSLGLSWYYYLVGNSFVSSSLIIVALFQPLLSGFSLFTSFLFAKKDFLRGALYMIVMNVSVFLALVTALFLGERAIILVATFFISKTLVSAYLYWKAQRHARNSRESEGLFRFSSHLSLMNITGAIADKLDSVIVFTLLGPVQLAIYTFAMAAPEQIKGIVKNLYGLALPKFASQSLIVTQRSILPKIGFLTMGLTAIIALYIISAHYIFSLLFPLYMDSVLYSQWYALSIIFSGIPPILYAALYAHKKTRELYIATNTAPVILICSLLILTPAYGIAGAIASQILFRFVNAAVLMWQFFTATDEALS